MFCSGSSRILRYLNRLRQGASARAGAEQTKRERRCGLAWSGAAVPRGERGVGCGRAETRCSGTAPCFSGGEKALRKGRLSFITTLRHGQITHFLGICLGSPIDTPLSPHTGPARGGEAERKGCVGKRLGPGGGWAAESGKDLQPAC